METHVTTNNFVHENENKNNGIKNNHDLNCCPAGAAIQINEIDF